MARTFKTANPLNMAVTLLVILLSATSLFSQSSNKMLKHKAIIYPLTQYKQKSQSVSENKKPETSALLVAQGFPTIECPAIQPLNAKENSENFDYELIFKRSSRLVSLAVSKDQDQKK